MSEKPGLFMKRTLAGLSPADDATADSLRTLSLGGLVEIAIKRPRDAKNLRRWWALARMLAYHTDQFRSPEIAHAYLKIRAGHAVPIVSKATGEVYQIADSIAFDRLDEAQFQDVWRRAVQVVCEEILPGVKEAEIEHEVLRLVGAAS